jgi:hypothetical protein
MKPKVSLPSSQQHVTGHKLSHKNSVLNLTSYFFKIHFKSPHLRLDLSNGL